ncbi:MAG: hypothetical protein ACXW3D_09850 [Caulobacteraceae bacterium]
MKAFTISLLATGLALAAANSAFAQRYRPADCDRLRSEYEALNATADNTRFQETNILRRALSAEATADRLRTMDLDTIRAKRQDLKALLAREKQAYIDAPDGLGRAHSQEKIERFNLLIDGLDDAERAAMTRNLTDGIVSPGANVWDKEARRLRAEAMQIAELAEQREAAAKAKYREQQACLTQTGYTPPPPGGGDFLDPLDNPFGQVLPPSGLDGPRDRPPLNNGGGGWVDLPPIQIDRTQPSRRGGDQARGGKDRHGQDAGAQGQGKGGGQKGGKRGRGCGG